MTLTEILPDLSVNERRTLVGYEPLEEEEKILAEQFGVGGTQSLIQIIENQQMSDEEKRNTIEVLFGLGVEQINKIFENG